MRVVWSHLAREDRRDLFSFLETRSLTAALRLDERIDEVLDVLREFPLSGRPGRVQGTRELVISETPYIAAYRVDGDSATILRLLHAAQQWPEQM